MTSCRSVDLLTTHTGTYRVDTRLLCETHDLVHLANLRARFPNADRTRGVRPVAVPETSEVQTTASRPRSPDPPPHDGVRPVRTRPDHGEVDLLVSELSQQISKISRDFGLASTRETSLHDLAVGGESAADPAAARRISSLSSLTARIIGRHSVGDR